jgi:predicted O-methyltransferase YrrM
MDLAEWAANLRKYHDSGRAIPYRMESDEAATKFWVPIDLLFIDADHYASSVLNDLKNWVPKVRPGGLVVGHDWDGQWADEVRDGVLAYWKREQFNVDRLYSSGRYLGECYWRYM